MIELDERAYEKVRELFAPVMAHQVFCTGVIDGLYAGRVYVDDAVRPRTAFAVKDGMWWFLAGSPANRVFNAALHRAMFDRTITGERGWGGMLVCDTPAWDAYVPVLFAPRIPIATRRLRYVCTEPLAIDWRSEIPAGIDIRFVDDSLAEDGIEVHGAAAETLELRRASAAPNQAAVGYVALHERHVVAYSVINGIVNGGGDIGLYTDAGFRRRGLAFVTSAAVIEYALAHGVDIVHWDCEAFNSGSIRTAQKLGLTLEGEHTMYVLHLNATLHEVNRAWLHFDAGRYADAMAICRQHIGAAPMEAHPHFHYVLARSLLETNQSAQAFEALQQAAAAGWDSVGEVEQDFALLCEHADWPSLLAAVRENATSGA
ncbi:MAG: GNAT family N-acetyltransferase [Chloroflexi bacterium]|nr:GNAT family N-acetyltransferase [Chloroflexota bacterium]